MTTTDMSINELLDHLGIVASVCQEIGLAAWLGTQDPGNRKPGKRGNGDRHHDPEWTRVEPPTAVCGAAILCQTSPSSVWLRPGITAQMRE
jgi:hypothetical protein